MEIITSAGRQAKETHEEERRTRNALRQNAQFIEQTYLRKIRSTS